jgi:hypothetical protein
MGAWRHATIAVLEASEVESRAGFVELRMAKHSVKRILAVVVVLALAALATHAVSHWHGHAYDEDHCQVCHVGHAAIPQAAAQVAEQTAAPIARLALAEELARRLDFAGTPSIPRAPPA